MKQNTKQMLRVGLKQKRSKHEPRTRTRTRTRFLWLSMHTRLEQVSAYGDACEREIRCR